MKSMVHWLIRASLAATFLFHGITKFPAAAAMSSAMGMPIYVVYALGLAETIGGILILVGGLNFSGSVMATKTAAAIFAIVMMGAIAMVHWPQWSFMPSPAKPIGGMEFQTLIIAVSLYFLARGNDV